MKIILTGLVIIVTSFVATLHEGEECQTENINGKCLNIYNCSYAMDLVKRNKTPQHCSFKGQDPIVCCLTSSNVSLSKITEDSPGKKSADQCKKYYPNSYVYDEGTAPGGDAYAGGIQTKPREFRHMALLGYGEPNNTQWLCGGTLISDQFVLTAAHCLYSPDLGKITKVRLGELDTNTTTDDANPQDYNIAERIAHPDFKAPSHYNDIALLKLDKIVIFDAYIKPACLHTTYDVPPINFIGTGWGKTDFYGELSSHLLQAELDHISHEECVKSYANVSPRKLQDGIIDEIQICAGSEEGRDSCPGDSGGPLQFKEQTPETDVHYSVLGVTSFGKACGAEHSVGVYTRVAPYTAWIEKLVWS